MKIQSRDNEVCLEGEEWNGFERGRKMKKKKKEWTRKWECRGQTKNDLKENTHDYYKLKASCTF